MNPSRTCRIVVAVVGLFMALSCQSPETAQEVKPTPTPEPPVVIQSGYCSFTITPPPFTEQFVLSRPDCHYEWRDTYGKMFSVWVSRHRNRHGLAIHEMSKPLDRIQWSKGEQHGHPYNQSIDEIEGKDSEDCDSKVVARFFDMPNKPKGEIIAVTAGACIEAWERDSYRNELNATLDSFRPL